MQCNIRKPWIIYLPEMKFKRSEFILFLSIFEPCLLFSVFYSFPAFHRPPLRQFVKAFSNPTFQLSNPIWIMKESTCLRWQQKLRIFLQWTEHVDTNFSQVTNDHWSQSWLSKIWYAIYIFSIPWYIYQKWGGIFSKVVETSKARSKWTPPPL